MSREPEVHLHLYLSRRGDTLAGRILVDGTERAFTGWIGLNATIDEVLESTDGFGAPDVYGDTGPGGEPPPAAGPGPDPA